MITHQEKETTVIMAEILEILEEILEILEEILGTLAEPLADLTQEVMDTTVSPGHLLMTDPWWLDYHHFTQSSFSGMENVPHSE